MSRPATSSGFTLLEVMLAVLVLALLTGLAAMSFRKPLEAAREREVVAQIRSADATARLESRRFSRAVELVIEPETSEIERRGTDGHETFRARIQRPYLIKAICIGSRRTSSPEVIRYSTSGLSRSFAVHVSGPQFDRWLLFAGLSGEVTEFADETQVQQVLSPTAQRGDAD